MQGNIFFSQSCNFCQGIGFIINHNCKSCNGEGFHAKQKTNKIKINPGMPNQAKLRLPNYGMPGLNNAPNGDLYLNINILPDKNFFRQDNKLITFKQINYSQLINGDSIDINLWRQNILVNIPSHFNDLMKPLIIPNKGFNNNDLLVFLKIKIPNNITDEQLKKLKDIQNEMFK